MQLHTISILNPSYLPSINSLMKPENQKKNTLSHKKKRKSNLLYIPILVLIGVGLLFFLTLNQRKSPSSIQEVGNKQLGIGETFSRVFSHNADQEKHSVLPKSTPEQNDQKATPGGEPNSIPTGGQSAPLNDTENSSQFATGSTQQPPMPSSAAEPSKQAVDTINSFYSHLDTQPYLQSFNLEKPSNVYFTELMQNLLDNPPIISRETDDLFTVLKNTAHFYRVIGKDNIVILKSIIDQEKPYVEEILANFYTLSEFPDFLQKNFALRVSTESLYNYAGFFLNTMGGRLYLFRRDSVSRMTVSYYGILLIDKANRESNNRNGIQIKEAIDALIAEIENSGNLLRLKERYLDKLYELKEKYQ
jgi:hypothetical protein